MICALMLDLDDAADFPGNTATALGRPLAAYPFMAARATASFRHYYVVTASPPVKAVALQNDAVIIDPLPGNASESEADRQLRHGFSFIVDDLEGEKLELLGVFFSNAPMLTEQALNDGLEALQARPAIDAAVTVSPSNRFHPSFARRENAAGLLEAYGDGATGKDRAWYPDWGAQLLRPRCLEGPSKGAAPFPWLGKNLLPLKQAAGGPIDYQWQIPSLEYWLKKHGVSDISANLERQPQPKPQPKPDRR